MGFLDRFKKDASEKGRAGSPDALTREAMARVRAVPGVEAVEALDADTLAVTWQGVGSPADLSLAEIRAPWTAASGFDRIEIMDDFISSVAPPLPGETTGEPVAEAAADAGPDATTDWEGVRRRLLPVVGRPGAPGADTVHWSVGGVLEATVVLDDPLSLPVSSSDVSSWGVDDAAVRAAAQENLAAIDPALDPIGSDEPAWVPTIPAGQLATWLCATDRLLAAAGLEEAVVLAPLPSELVLVDPAATELVQSILSSTRTIVEKESRPLWPAPFLARPGSLEPWQPPADHPCAGLVAEMRGLAD